MSDRTSALPGLLLLFALIAGPIPAHAFGPGQKAPDIAGGPWINSEPLTLGKLAGRVVLVEFWTYG